ncbi:type II restriction enzyme, methylase subunit [Candidatus Caldarchaeum subterraneum]|uniref:site-specific DNA-methyltransferase (adenine-specific) n=1 Tax=Caldiarchaeum subterraneum TaxID=311458 RepID=E6N613_CALS0|nr:type II restriction enzyme, methylase subunit [Candidatus Caldarchaeum subterraneum]BAJ49439.1 type II restriction enzyme, methylase subunit [Candidatus Caldarchaeum subterraneum]BAJ50607.1 type II restriction enzyme, methylase subunit [Candidatus Caldarchaeum subterraneum]
MCLCNRLFSGFLFCVFMDFGLGFWRGCLAERGYVVGLERLDLDTLVGTGVLPRDGAREAYLLYRDDFVEVVVLVYDDLPSRGYCARVARRWRERTLFRPLLIFTDNRSSYAAVVRGAGLGGEVRLLHLEEQLYRTDLEALNSLKHPGSPEELRRKYDEEFFPYERVREEFFEQYKVLYEKLVGIVKPCFGDKRAKEYAQRFLGRLMFLYFLQRKGWLKNDKRYIDKISGFRELNRLFYDMLNKPGGGDGVPYLNGSLFDRESYLTEDVERRIEKKMDSFFHEARELFNRYNFTVDETSSLEVEVSVDPLLLGTVLENMLPEHERGEKGTFYTPVSEISFICRKAVQAWLGLEDRVDPSSGRLVDGLEEYVRGLKERRNDAEIREFREKLLSVKVCDPAVGSGGFLVVMMQTILSLVQEVEEALGWRADPAIYKSRILPNLYGFDIEPEAVEIARLRLWLSLIVDQKVPEPLPNLDLNIMVTSDSLSLPAGGQSVIEQYYSSSEIREKVDSLNELRRRYAVEHNPVMKRELQNRVERVWRELMELAGGREARALPLELIMMSRPDIVVMNPPYVRQEKIPKNVKEHYVKSYGLDRTSDIYAYFMVRALKLLNERGAAVIISSDKWLEVGYGLKLQEVLKPYLLAIYGQRERSFGADVNTVITMLRKEKLPGNHPIQFIYLSRYGGDEVINYKSIPRDKLKPGKWYYLRAPRIFEEVLLPKLTHKLKDFAEIKFGIKTGANEFFYMKDVTHLYEADYLSNPRRFEQWGVKAKTAKELQQQELIYIENEAGERFVIDRKDVKPIIRSPREIRSYIIKDVRTLCLYTANPGRYTRKYITWGEQQGYHQRPTCRARNPWWALPQFQPAHILLTYLSQARYFVPLARESVLCDHLLYALYTKNINETTTWVFLNSTLFYVVAELFCRRLGGGAKQIMVEDYEDMPVPNLNNLMIDFPVEILASNVPLQYSDEVKREERRMLDKAVLKALGFPENELDRLVDELHRAFVWVVEDRLIKSGRPLQAEEEQVAEVDQDN